MQYGCKTRNTTKHCILKQRPIIKSSHINELITKNPIQQQPNHRLKEIVPYLVGNFAFGEFAFDSVSVETVHMGIVKDIKSQARENS